MKIIALGAFLVLLAYWFWPRTNYSESGLLADLPKQFDLLQNSTSSFETLVISVNSTSEFVQFSKYGKNIELDFPLVTDNQKILEPKFREVCKVHALEIRDSEGSDGSRFLDVDLPQGTEKRATIVKNILTDVFDVTERAKLKFTFR